MTRQVNIHDAKTHFSKLVDEVEHGGDVVIARAGKPVLRLVRIEADAMPRKLGFAKDSLRGFSQTEWDALDADVASMFDWTKLEDAGK